MNMIWKWFIDSNHYKHFSACAIIALICGFVPSMITGLAVEYKDYSWGGEFDWSDIIADALGAILGTAIRFLILKDITRIIC